MPDMKTDEDMINLKTYQSILGSCRFELIPPTLKLPTLLQLPANMPIGPRHGKRILRYLAGATNSCLYYPSRQKPTFRAFSDSD
jgi:hypothetical protein